MRDLRLSGDGSRAILGGGLSWVPVYSTKDGTKVDDLAMFPEDARLACFSHDASLAVTARESGLLIVFALNQPPPTPPQHLISLADYCPEGEFASSAVALHPDGKRFALAGTGYWETSPVTSSRVFDIATGQAAGPVLDPGGRVLAAEFSPDGETLALLATTSAAPRREARPLPKGQPGTLQFWDWKSGTRLGDPVPMPSEPRWSAFIRHGASIAVLCAVGEVVEVDLATHAVRPLFETGEERGGDHPTIHGSVGCSPDGDNLVTWGHRHTVHVWNIAGNQPRFARLQLPYHGTDLDFLPDKTMPGVFSTVEFFSDKPAIRFYETATGKEAARPIPIASDAYCGRFSPDGTRFLVGGTRSRSARLYDWRTGTAICPEVLHGFEVFSGAFVPGSSWCLTGDQFGRVYLWDGNTGRFLMPAISTKATPALRSWTSKSLPIPISQSSRQSIPVGFGSSTSAPCARTSRWMRKGHGCWRRSTPRPGFIEGGGTVRLDPSEWFERWQEFRRRYPDFHRFPAGK